MSLQPITYRSGRAWSLTPNPNLQIIIFCYIKKKEYLYLNPTSIYFGALQFEDEFCGVGPKSNI